LTNTPDHPHTPRATSTPTHDCLTRTQPDVSRVCYSDTFQGEVGANLASRELKAKTAAIEFDCSNDYSVRLETSFRTQ
ncbi:branched-chain amino acid ABC transporter substrate-binding protein, partial [Klebsiella pneumoniae]|nr:branched-chain amino acid ABC transporter substrate-binding protein [Klebsiella pneumoniae]